MGDVKGDAPEAPNPYALAGAQGQLNQSSLLDNYKYGTFDQFAPWGSTVWIRDKNGNPIGQSILLDDDQLSIYNNNTGISNALSGSALNQSQYLPTDQLNFGGMPYDPWSIDAQQVMTPEAMSGLVDYGQLSTEDLQPFMKKKTLEGERKRIEDAMYERAMALQRKDFENQQDQMNTMLVERGIPMASEIDSQMRENFTDRQNEAQQRAAMDAIMAGGTEMQRMFGMNAQQRAQQLGEQQAVFNSLMAQRQNQMGEMQAQASEQSRLAALMQAIRGQGINEYLQQRYEPMNLISSYLQGSPALPTSGFMGSPNYQMSAPNFMGAAQQNYANQMGQYNQQQANLWGGLGSIGSALAGGLFGF